MRPRLGSGFNTPPGCYRVPGDEDEGPCAVCCRPVADCVCDECPTCKESGNPACYAFPPRGPRTPGEVNPSAHGMLLTRTQVQARFEARLAALEAQEKQVRGELAMLTSKTPDDVIFSDESPFSRRLADNPDPWR